MNEHFLPRFYLERWCRNRRLIRYEKRGAEILTEEKFPAEVGYRPDQFALHSRPDKPNVIEIDYWQRLDNDAAPIFSSLINNTPAKITPQEQIIMTLFILGLPIRTPWAQDHAVAVLKAALAGEFPEFLDPPKVVRDSELQRISDPNWLRDNAILNSLKIATESKRIDRLMRMQWHVWDLRYSIRDLVLSDHALLVAGSLDHPVATTFRLPLSPRRLLVITDDYVPRLSDYEVASAVNILSTSAAVEHIFAAHTGHRALAKRYLKPRNFRKRPEKFPNVPAKL
jgi:hypothetical protein